MATTWRATATAAVAACLAAACNAEPRAAVCFFGLTRSIPYTIDTIRSHILDPLVANGISYTTFVHTYNVSELNNPRSLEHHVPVDWTAFKLLQPAASIVDDAERVFNVFFKENFKWYLQHGDPWGEAQHTSLRNLLLQLFSLKRVAALQEESAKKQGPFDLVLLLRSDLFFFNKLNIDHVWTAMQSNSTIYVPAFDDWGGFNDRFAFGSPTAISKIAHRLDDALMYAGQHQMHSESFLKHSVEAKGLAKADTDIIFQRVRGHGFMQQMPQFDKAGAFKKWALGKWMRLNSLGMWEFTTLVPAGYNDIDTVLYNMRETAQHRVSAFMRNNIA